MAIRAALAVVGVAAALVVPVTAAAPGPTPDQRLVSGLREATSASQSALRSLARATEARVDRATKDLDRTIKALETARAAAPAAVGALETRSVRRALQRATNLTRSASRDVARGRYTQARTKIRQAIALKAAALRDFGRPLRREFTATAVNRNFRNVPLFREYSGVTASASEEVVEIVIGLATRETANAGEPYAGFAGAPGMRVAALTAYQIQDPIGAYTTNWCSFDTGLITCPLRPTLTRDHLFTLAFTPKLARGTKVLVKFLGASGRTSYSVYSVR